MSDPANHTQIVLPQASEKQFEHFIELVNARYQLQQVRNLLLRFNPSILSKLEFSFRQPALYFAVTSSTDNNSFQMLKFLVQNGANPKHKDQNDQTILFYACRDGKLLCCRFLLQECGLSCWEQDMYGQTPLFYVASQNKLNLLELFDDKVEQINHADKLANQTPLYYAARKGYTQMCKKLVQKGANPANIDSQNKTAADYAKKARHNQTAQYLNFQLRKQKQILAPPQQSAQLSAGRDQSQQSNKRKKKDSNVPVSNIPRATYKIVFMNQKGEAKDLTQEQVRGLVRNNPTLETYLTNPSSIPIEQLQKMEKTQTWQKVASKLLQVVMKQKGAYWFLQPVDPVKFNIMDYFDIIQKPMDFGTIKKKLTHNVYHTAAHFVADMNLVWNNSIRYNGELHQISKTAKQLQGFFTQEYKKSGLAVYVQ